MKYKILSYLPAVTLAPYISYSDFNLKRKSAAENNRAVVTYLAEICAWEKLSLIKTLLIYIFYWFRFVLLISSAFKVNWTLKFHFEPSYRKWHKIEFLFQTRDPVTLDIWSTEVKY